MKSAAELSPTVFRCYVFVRHTIIRGRRKRCLIPDMTGEGGADDDENGLRIPAYRWCASRRYVVRTPNLRGAHHFFPF